MNPTMLLISVVVIESIFITFMFIIRLQEMEANMDSHIVEIDKQINSVERSISTLADKLKKSEETP